MSKALPVLLVRTQRFPALRVPWVRWVLLARWVLRVRLQRFPVLPDLRVRLRLCQVPPDLLAPLAPRVLLRPFLALRVLLVLRARKVTLDPLDPKARKAFRVSKVFRASQFWLSASRARLILSRNFLPTLCRVTCG